MKKILMVCLAVCMAVFFFACDRAAEPEEMTTTEAITTTEVTTIKVATTVAPTTEPSPERLSDQQARTLAADIAQRSMEIQMIFIGGLAGKHESVDGEVLRVGENPQGITSIPSLKAFVEKTYTKACAESFYNDENMQGDCGIFFEKEGVLYMYRQAGGFEASVFPETAQVTSQTEDTLTLALEYGMFEETSGINWRLKWEDGAWKLDCPYSGYSS